MVLPQPSKLVTGDRYPLGALICAVQRYEGSLAQLEECHVDIVEVHWFEPSTAHLQPSNSWGRESFLGYFCDGGMVSVCLAANVLQGLIPFVIAKAKTTSQLA